MKHITDAYIQVHGECPSRGYDAIAVWNLRLAMFRSGWACALAWKEEQDEMLEIEKDVLDQQKEITR